MTLPAVSLSLRSFMAAFAMYMLPMVVVAVPLVLFVSSDVPRYVEPGDGRSLLGALAMGSLLSPAFETLVLIYLAYLAAPVIRSHWLTCIVAAAPIALWHAPDGWVKVPIVASAFIWSAHCYLELSRQEVSLSKKFLFLFGIHALSNTVLLVCLFFMH